MAKKEIAKKLPDAEFEVMKVVWSLPSPVTAALVTENLPKGNKWKLQTVGTLLDRLVEKQFLSTEKKGRDRLYTPLVSEQGYLAFETKTFVNQYHNRSILQLINTFNQEDALSEQELSQLIDWAQKRRE